MNFHKFLMDNYANLNASPFVVTKVSNKQALIEHGINKMATTSLKTGVKLIANVISDPTYMAGCRCNICKFFRVNAPQNFPDQLAIRLQVRYANRLSEPRPDECTYFICSGIVKESILGIHIPVKLSRYAHIALSFA